MSNSILMQYLGFESKNRGREYAFQVRYAAEDVRDFTLTIADDTNFTWAFAAPGKPPVTIRGTYSLANGVLTLSGNDFSTLVDIIFEVPTGSLTLTSGSWKQAPKQPTGASTDAWPPHSMACAKAW